MKLVIDISGYNAEWIRNAYGIPQEININIAESIINAEPYSDWIPCSERLPEDERNVLITYYDDITIGWYRKSENTWMIYEGETNAEPDEVTAWMPLPESYKGVTK